MSRCYFCKGVATHWIIAIVQRVTNDRTWTVPVDFHACTTHKVGRTRVLGDTDKARGWKLLDFSSHSLIV